MILIISNAHYEPTTDYVIDWLRSEGANFIRINCEDISQQRLANVFDPSSDSFTVAGRKISYQDVKVVWYRRWYHYAHLNFGAKNAHERQLYWETMKESDSILRYLWFCFKHCSWLTKPTVNQFHEKLYALRVAEQQGLAIPRSLVTNQRSELEKFMESCDEVITKPIANPGIFVSADGKTVYKSYTEVLTAAFVRKLPRQFYLSLFQERVKADFEIRTFFLGDEYYSTAMLHSATVDIKLSVRTNQHISMVAYQLPEKVLNQLRATMDELDLNTGSFDLIRTKEGEYVFIEVNPIGQFTGYGNAANYPLAKKVAEWLIEKNQQSIHYGTQKMQKPFQRDYA